MSSLSDNPEWQQMMFEMTLLLNVSEAEATHKMLDMMMHCEGLATLRQYADKVLDVWAEDVLRRHNANNN